MKLKDLSRLFNRSWEYAFNVRKFLYMFLTLVIVGLIFLFFQAMTPRTSPWLQFAFRYAPFFVAGALLMAIGAFLIKMYMQEKEEGDSRIEGSFKPSFISSSEPFMVASYCALAVLCAFIVLWVVIGILILLKSIPFIGTFLGVILSFCPVSAEPFHSTFAGGSCRGSFFIDPYRRHKKPP